MKLWLANFYKQLLKADNGSDDEVHQTIISQETMLTVYNDGSIKNNSNQNICLAFTVDDIEEEYKRVVDLGADITSFSFPVCSRVAFSAPQPSYRTTQPY